MFGQRLSVLLMILILIAVSAGLAAETKRRTDLQGDPLPAGAIARLGSSRFRLSQEIEKISFSVDGKTLDAFTKSGAVRWEIPTGKIVPTTKDDFKGVSKLKVYSPDGKRFAEAAHESTSFVVRDAQSKKVLLSMGPFDNIIYQLAYSPNGKFLASACGDMTVRIWNAENGKQLQELKGHQNHVQSVAFSPDSQTVVSGASPEASQFSLRLWDVKTGKELKKIHTPEGAYCVAFSPDGKILASASTLIRLWNPKTGKEIFQHRGHVWPISGVAFALDGKTLATAGGTGKIIIWDVAASKERLKIQVKEGFGRRGGLCFSSNGKHLLVSTGRKDCWLFDTSNGKSLHKFKGVQAIFSPDGKVVASTGERKDPLIRLWEVGSGKLVREIKEPSEGRSSRITPTLAFSPDGRILASSPGDWNERIYLWDTHNGEKLKTLEGKIVGRVVSMSFDNKGKYLVAGTFKSAFSRGTTIYRWEIASGKQVSTSSTPGHHGVGNLSSSPDGRHVAFTGRAAQILDITTGKVVHSFEAPQHITFISWSPDGKTVATGQRDGTVLIWDWKALKKLGKQSQ